MKLSKNIQTDQERFFNDNSLTDKPPVNKNLFYYYSNKEQFLSFNWLEDAKTILEYGCGTGTSLDIFFEDRKRSDYKVFGVDIAESAINKAKKNYPEYNFYKISNNVIPQIPDNSIDGAFMLHVLHHSHDHEDIFREVYSKLKKGGKFFLNDLSSRNPFIRIGRFVFSLFSDIFKNKFPEDLVVEGVIPDKYPVDINLVMSQLKKAGFRIVDNGEGHLFFFLFAWLDKFVPFSKFVVMNELYKVLIKAENYLVKHTPLKKYAEVFYIMCVKD